MATIVSQYIITIETEGDDENHHEHEVDHLVGLLEDVAYDAISPETSVLIDEITTCEVTSE